jgi:hypothetical protein
MLALGTWDVILGDPLRYHDVDPQLPSDPLMIESIDPRMGTNPITGDALVQPSEAVGPQDNPINGHEYSNERRDDLQYACTFRLAMPTECDANNLNCSCSVDANADSPLCQDPATGDYGNKQHFVSAYPAIRHLSLMRAIGDTALLGSICPAESAVPQTQYGYQPTVGALLARIDPLLR